LAFAKGTKIDALRRKGVISAIGVAKVTAFLTVFNGALKFEVVLHAIGLKWVPITEQAGGKAQAQQQDKT